MFNLNLIQDINIKKTAIATHGIATERKTDIRGGIASERTRFAREGAQG